MPSNNSYDVTTWPIGDAREDVGAVINSMLADVRARQQASDVEDGGKPGAVIHIPPGDYRLRTQVLIDISYLRIEGAGHGFTSSSIRFNVPPEEWPDLHELWPGGSRILVDLPRTEGGDEAPRAAFRVARAGSPRISSVEFAGFCIDGMHFEADGSTSNPENSYLNGKTGIYVADSNDSFRITGMGLVYLENAVTIHNADALSIHDNFIAECGTAIELRGWGQASKITDNLIGAGPSGRSIYAENHGGLIISTNNVFPRGASSIHLHGVTRSNVSNNRLHSFYPGMVILDAGSSENLVAANHLLRDHEPWTPFIGIDNGLDDLYGLLVIGGNDNSVLANHVSVVLDSRSLNPGGAAPVVIRLAAGSGNQVSNNHVVGLDVAAASNDSCFEGQVDALLTTQSSQRLTVTAVMIHADSIGNTILDSALDDEVVLDRSVNVFRPTPSLGIPVTAGKSDTNGRGQR